MVIFGDSYGLLLIIKISVVICTKDRLDDLNKTLRSIAGESHLRDEVVDATEGGGSEDHIESGDLVVRYVAYPRGGFKVDSTFKCTIYESRSFSSNTS